ncbi:hypothetical protein BDZ45DRAFT_182080 [Acephala macrosclerotiorum]|nr:hypothetical protein BDZ45DRAFT_182080 [Acephala macrosclerotiorum]
MFLLVASALTFLLTLTHCFHARSTPITSFANTTIVTSSTVTPVTSNCCFVIQDTVNEVWWEEYTVGTVTSTVTITSITTFITVFQYTTLSSITTNIIYSPTTAFSTLDVGLNLVKLYLNRAPGPVESTTRMKNTTQTVVGGVTVTSAAAFYVYSTVKIVTAPAVTDQNGQLRAGHHFHSLQIRSSGPGPYRTSQQAQ